MTISGEQDKYAEKWDFVHNNFIPFAPSCLFLSLPYRVIDWLIDSLLFEYGNFISYITSLHESRIETEVNTVQLH